jgi:hypothetical protein
MRLVNRFSERWRRVFYGKSLYCGFCKGDLDGYLGKLEGVDDCAFLKCQNCGRIAEHWMLPDTRKLK